MGYLAKDFLLFSLPFSINKQSHWFSHGCVIICSGTTSPMSRIHQWKSVRVLFLPNKMGYVIPFRFATV